MDTSWLAIINPHAGIPLSMRQQRCLIEKLKYELDAEVVVTQTAGHIAELVSGIKDDTAFAVFGGDGTIAEVVNQMDLNHQQLLPLYGGTGNGLARDLGLTTLDKSFDAVRNNRKLSIDILRVTFRTQHAHMSRLAVSTTALGYAAETVVMAKRLFRRLGPMRYSLALIMRAMQTHTFKLTMHANGNTVRDSHVSTVMINNTRHAGNFSIFPKASLYDKRMDIFLANGLVGSQILPVLIAFIKNKSFTADMEFSTQTLSLQLDSPLQLMIDGEIWKDVTEVDFEFLPNGLICFAGDIQ